MTVDVRLDNGMVVTCHQKHEVALVFLEAQSYFSGGIHLEPGDVVFDVGANIGLFSLAAYDRAGRDLEIYAFEPIPEVAELLARNAARNAAPGQIRSFTCALGAGARDDELAYYPRAPVLSTLYPDPEADLRVTRDYVVHSIMHLPQAPLSLRAMRLLPARLRDALLDFGLRRTLTARNITVRTRTLSEIVTAYRVPRIDLLKIDVEKAELDVLEGIAPEHWPLIRQAVVEVHDLGERIETIERMLHEGGLTRLEISQAPTLGQSNIYNIFARRPERP